jgi:hypothetical protein
MSGKSPSRIATNITEAIAEATAAGLSGIRVYVEAKNVSSTTFLGYLAGKPGWRGNPVISGGIYVRCRDVWVVVPVI